MLTRELLDDAIRYMGVAVAGQWNGAGKFTVSHITISTVQRRVRVGWVTAARIVEALGAAGVVGHVDRHGRHQVLAYDLQAGRNLVTEAIDDGRIELTCVSNTQPRGPSVVVCTPPHRECQGQDRCQVVTAPQPPAVDRG